jgi:hypothetical protein
LLITDSQLVLARSDAVVRTVDGLDSGQRQAFWTLVDTEGKDAIELVGKLDGSDVRFVLDEFEVDAQQGVARAIGDGVDTDRISKSLKRYRDLDSNTLQDQYREIASHQDPEVRNSWFRQSGREDLESELPSDLEFDPIEYSLELSLRVGDVKGHRILKFQRASKANDYLNLENDPYPDGTIVVRLETRTESKLVRVVSEDRDRESPGRGPEGRFFIPNAQRLEELNYDPAEIQSKYALMEKPYWLYDAEIPTGTTMHAGKVAKNFGEAGGGTQYTIAERLDDDVFESIPQHKRKLEELKEDS